MTASSVSDVRLGLRPPFDGGAAQAFYVEWLGFVVDWEHQFEPGLPKYVQISRGAVVRHLTEPWRLLPGAKVFINTDDVDAIQRELSCRPNPNIRPAVETAPWNAKVMEVIDPFGNGLCFNQPL